MQRVPPVLLTMKKTNLKDLQKSNLPYVSVPLPLLQIQQTSSISPMILPLRRTRTLTCYQQSLVQNRLAFHPTLADQSQSHVTPPYPLPPFNTYFPRHPSTNPEEVHHLRQILTTRRILILISQAMKRNLEV
jgi:hypothetical protein